jgi:cell division protein FtsQ
MKRVVYITLNILLLASMLLVLSFSGSKEKEVLCSEVKINMKDTLASGFLTKKDIERTLLSEDSEILGYPIRGINIRELEKKFRDIPYVEDAQLYIRLDGVLHVDIVQRKPVVRVMTRYNNTYYLDESGYIFPATSKFTPHVLIANGYFTEGEKLRNSNNIHDLKGNEDFKEWEDVLKLSVYMRESDFWQSQIVQLYRNRNGDFELIPRVGAHQIIFGDADDIEVKFNKLKTLYEEGLKYEGWNKYEIINLKYNNQVICTKR